MDRILVPTDGSAPADRALAHADFLAREFGATLHYIHVYTSDAGPPDSLEITTFESSSLDDRPELLDEAPYDVVKRSVTYPSVSEGIVRYAKQEEMDLIAMGTHGYQGIRRAILGSVAEKVVRYAHCPVFTVHANSTATPVREINHILAPIDFSSHTHVVTNQAAAFASRYKARVTLMHVLEDVAVPTTYGIDPLVTNSKSVRSRVAERLNTEVEALKTQGVEAESLIRTGHPAEEILTVAEKEAVDLITIATLGRTGIPRFLLGSVTEKVVRQALCPVLTARGVGAGKLVHEDPSGKHDAS